MKLMIASRYLRLPVLCCAILVSFITLLHAEMPPGLPGDHYAIRKYKPGPCKFAPEYNRIKSDKSDPRVAYIELWSLAHPEAAPIGFHGLCRTVSEQVEDNVVIFDRKHAFLHLLFGDQAIVSDAITYFSGTTKSSGVILYVTRFEDDWRAFVFTNQDNKWHDETAQYLGHFNLGEKDYIVVPQYGRSARVLTYDGNRFRHKMWLTWDGAKFTASFAKKMPGWRCPDSYRYFDRSDRAQYCR